MKTLCIIPCGSKKIWDKYPKAGPKAAKNVYIGPFAKKCKEYAEKYYTKAWCILSAKYGFLFPKDVVPEKYNVSFNDKKSAPISTDTLLGQVKRRRLKRFDRFVILGGKNYVNIIKSILPDKNISTPLSGCRGIGYMMKKLNDSINDGKTIR